MRDINLIVVHCSATRPSQDIGADEIRRWHVDDNNWSDIGYHYVIRRDGTLEKGRSVEKPGAHAVGYNANSIGVCLVGGVGEDGKTPENNFTSNQFRVLKNSLDKLRDEYPDARIKGHRDLPGVNKACPSFDVCGWYEDAILDAGRKLLSDVSDPAEPYTITSADVLRLIEGASLDVPSQTAALSTEARDFVKELIASRLAQ